MNKLKLLKIINPVLGISLILQALAITAMILEIAPRWLFKMHKFNGVIFIIIAIFHVTLNWGWIKANFMKKKENN